MGASHTNRKWIQTVPSLAAAAVALGVAALAVAAAPIAHTAVAQAVATIQINPGNVPTTAAGFDTISCENLAPGAGQDG